MILPFMPCTNHPWVAEPLVWCTRCGKPFCHDCVVEIGGQTYCAPCKQEALGDLRAGLPTTGGEMASIGSRFVAMFLDGLVVGIPLALVVGVMILAAIQVGGVRREPDAGFILLFEGVFFLVAVACSILYEALLLSRSGQTIGKKLMHIKVVSAEGGPLSTGQAFGRAGVRQALGFVPCVGLIDYLVAFGEQRTCIHDMAARTRVIVWNP
jgi:uncharacterized RDD family membrane protein YckC